MNLLWVRVKMRNDEEEWTVGMFTGEPIEALIVGSDEPYEVLEIGDPVARSSTLCVECLKLANNFGWPAWSGGHLPGCAIAQEGQSPSVG